MRPQAILVNGLALLVGWCFGGECGLGIAASLLIWIHVRRQG